MLGCSRQAVYDLLKRNEFPSYVVGGKHIVSKRGFDKWLDGEWEDVDDEDEEE